MTKHEDQNSLIGKSAQRQESFDEELVVLWDNLNRHGLEKVKNTKFDKFTQVYYLNPLR